MNDAFYQLDTAKQNKIINAALKEFTEKGFEHASTNQIVKNAGIAKGTLFYYFNNKKDLYLYLVEYCLRLIRENFFNRVDMTEKDLIERWKMVSYIKMDYLRRFPNAINFITRAALQEEEHLDDALKEKIDQLQAEGEALLFQDIDYRLFRKDVDPERAIKLIQWVFAGFEQELKQQLKQLDVSEGIDYQPYFDEFFAYLEMLKRAFYASKEDEQ